MYTYKHIIVYIFKSSLILTNFSLIYLILFRLIIEPNPKHGLFLVDGTVIYGPAGKPH